jgi:hypothetical protein
MFRVKCMKDLVRIYIFYMFSKGNRKYFFFFITSNSRISPNVNDSIILVLGHGGPYGYQTSRLQHFLDNRLTDGGEVVSLTRQQPFTPRKIPGTHFC